MQVSDQIIEILNYLGEKIGVSIDWTSENVMPYVQELCNKYINYEIATSIMWIFITLITFGIIVSLCKKFKNTDDDLFLTFLPLLATVAIIAIIIIICQTLDILKCVIIPELAIYNKVQELLN